ncbi:MAG: hypothetical protein AVDCRST_MAG78-478, partial [uncultured Rubrobacteraceae bacterium]
EAFQEGSLDLRGLRWYRPALRVEFDGGAGRGGAPGDLYPRRQRNTGGPDLRTARLSPSRGGGLL